MSTLGTGSARRLVLTIGAGVTLAAGGLLFAGSPEPWTLRGDNVQVVHPITAAVHHALRRGEVPEWSGGLWGGYPLVAEVNAAPFYPPHHLAFLLTPWPHLRAYDLAFAFHAGLLASGTAALLVLVGASATAAALGAVLVVLFPLPIWWASGMLMVYAAFAWWPWICVAGERLSRRRPGRVTRPAAWIAVAAPVYAGYPEFALYGGLLGGGWLLFRGGEVWWGRRAARALVMGLGGIALAAPQLFVTGFFAAETTRGRLGTADLTVLGKMLARDPAVMLHPFAAVTSLPVFVGAATVVLSVIGGARRGAGRWYLLGASVLAFLLALGHATPVYGWIHAAPPFSIFRLPEKFLFVVGLCLAWLSALGFDALRGTGAARALAGVLALVATGERAVFTLGFGATRPLAGVRVRPADVARDLQATDLLAQPRRADAAPPRLLELPRRTATNLPLLFGVEALSGGPVALRPRLVTETIPAFGRPGAIVDAADWLIVRDDAELCRHLLRRGGFVPRRQWDDACVLENRAPLPRYALLDRVEPMETEADLVAAARRGGPAVPVLAGAAALAPYLDAGGAPGSVAVSAYAPGDVQLTVTAARPRLLLVRETWAPGWEVRVDGVRVDPHPAAGMFFALPVPAGTSDVTLRYRAPGLRAGAGVAAAWLLSAGLLSMLSRRGERGVSDVA